MPDDRFVSLHRHDQYSLWDGVDMAVRAVQRVADLEQPAVALTNHGTIYGLIDHFKACVDAGVKPILGVEAYVTLREDKPEKGQKLCHQTILVENEVGYKNLMRLVTRSYDYMYFKPRVPLSLLREYKEGLIVMSGCPSSLLQRYLQAGDVERAERLFAWFAREFKGQYYAELQHHALAAQTAPATMSLAAKYGVPVVATNDAHYTEPADRLVHDTLLKVRHKGKGEENPTYGDGYYITSRKEMGGLLRKAHPWMESAAISAALDETVRVAERVNFTITKPDRMLPPLWDEPDKRLTTLAWQGLERKGLAKRLAYSERMRHEIDVVLRMGYSEYFNLAYDVTNWARGAGILIGPRGSVCGSLMAYALGVTMVDPLVHGTMFERFLHDKKKSYPDVDLDIDNRYRERVTEWVMKTYAPFALPIITFGRFSGGNVATYLQQAWPEEISTEDRHAIRAAVDDIRIVQKVFVTEQKHLEDYEVFHEMEERIPGFRHVVMKLYGMVLYVSRHPGGMVFTPDDPRNYYARIQIREKPLTSYNYVDVEYIGLLKFDFLSLAAMATLHDTTRLVRERHGVDLRLEDIPLDDVKCYDRFASGDTDSVFQFETSGGRNILRKIEPDKFQEVAAATALNRPGVSANVDAYVRGKKLDWGAGVMQSMNVGDRDGKSLATLLREALAPTYGTFVYQENIAYFLRGIDLPWEDVDTFLKGLKTNATSFAATIEGHKGLPIFKKLRAVLLEHGASPERIESFMFRVTQYSFNKSHAVGYALVAYWMQWLRTHWPLEYWCSLLDAEGIEPKRVAYEGSAIADGVVLLPPHVNASAGYTIEGNAIRVGLNTIKGLGDKTARAIVAGGPYEMARDIRRLPKRVVNARSIKVLVEARALDMDTARWGEYAVTYNEERRDGSRAAIYGRWGVVGTGADKEKKGAKNSG